MIPKQKKVLGVRIEAELKREAKMIAVEAGRSLSNWVTQLIENEVKKAKQGVITENNGIINSEQKIQSRECFNQSTRQYSGK